MKTKLLLYCNIIKWDFKHFLIMNGIEYVILYACIHTYDTHIHAHCLSEVLPDVLYTNTFYQKQTVYLTNSSNYLLKQGYFSSV